MSRRTEHGFTLLELLVALTLTLGIAAVMLAVTSSTLSLWRRTQDNFTVTSQAKLALDLIEKDVQSAVFRRDPNATWLALAVSNSTSGLTSRGWQLASRMKPATAESRALLPLRDDGSVDTIARARFGVAGAWIRFLSTGIASASEGTVPRAIAYQIARRPVGGTISASNQAEVRYALFRSNVTGATTFANGNDVLASTYGTTLSSPSAADILLPNVVDFGAWLYVRDNAGALRRIYPADASDDLHNARDPGGVADGSRYPQIVDFMVRVLSDDGARQVAALEQGTVTRPAGFATDAEWWWAVVEANSTVFVRRVEVKGGTQ